MLNQVAQSPAGPGYHDRGEGDMGKTSRGSELLRKAAK